MLVQPVRFTGLCRHVAPLKAEATAKKAKAAIQEARQAGIRSGNISLKELGADSQALPPSGSQGSAGKGKAKGRGKSRQGRVRASVSSASAGAQAPAQAPARESKLDEVPGFSFKTMYKTSAPQPERTAREEVGDIHMVLAKEWANYDKFPDADLEEDPAEWWKSNLNNGLQTPYIAILARACMGVPGTSADMERAFSHAGATLTPKRARLEVGRACDTVFVHENIIKGNV